MFIKKYKEILRSDVIFNAKDEDVDKAGVDDADDEKDDDVGIDIVGDEDNLGAMSKEELLQKAKDMGLDVNANMSKEDLIKIIREA